MKIIYLYDGTPKIINNEEDYPNESWTETPPPEGIYQPYYFDGDEWIGTTREEWLSTLPKQELDKPNPNDFLNTQLLSNDLEHNSKIDGLQQDIANLTAQLLELQGGMTDVHDS